jgi:hypothetical protein
LDLDDPSGVDPLAKASPRHDVIRKHTTERTKK